MSENRNTNSIDQWLDTATRKIRFGPDREAVRRELTGHIEDLLERRSHLSSDEAERQALSAMGDAAALALELERVHRPWWGWLWRISSVAALLSVVFVLGAVIYSMGSPLPDLISHMPPQQINYSTSSPYYSATLLEEYAIAGGPKLGPYRFTAPAVWTEQVQYADPSTAETRHTYRLTIHLCATTWQFWAPSSTAPAMVCSRPVTDSCGTPYGCAEYIPYTNNTVPLSVSCWAGGPGETWYRFQLELADAAPPSWVRLPIGQGDDTLTISFEKGVLNG